MKKIFIFFLFFSMLIIAQEKNESLEKGMFFRTKSLAGKAFRSGNFRYYQPDPKNLKSHPPFLAKGLPRPFVVLEKVRENSGKSPAWILLSAGTPVVFNSRGIPVQDGRCWNSIIEAYPVVDEEQYIPLSMLGSLQVPGHQGDRGPRGFMGKNGYVLVFDPFYYKNLSWEIPVIGIIIWGIIKILIPNNSSPAGVGVGPGGNTGPAF